MYEIVLDSYRSNIFLNLLTFEKKISNFSINIHEEVSNIYKVNVSKLIGSHPENDINKSNRILNSLGIKSNTRIVEYVSKTKGNKFIITDLLNANRFENCLNAFMRANNYCITVKKKSLTICE